MGNLRGKKKKLLGRGGKGRSKKVSVVKLSNKHLNKLAKQGKLKKRVPKKELLKLLHDRTSETITRDQGQEVNEDGDFVEERREEMPLNDTDYEFFGQRHNKELGFLLNLKSNEKEKNRKRKKKDVPGDEGDDLEQRYEKKAALSQGENRQMKAMLPIKSKEKGIEMRMVEAENMEDEDSEKENEVAEQPAEPLPTLSTAELFAKRQFKIVEIKQKIAELASALIENPQKNVNKLRELRLMLEISDPDVMVTSKKLAMMSLLEVFKDIIPGYPIRLATDKEKEQSAGKDTKFLRGYEESLLRNYKNYLEALETLSKGQKLKAKDKTKSLEERVSGIEIPTESVQALRELSVKCMCELLVSNPHFNYRSQIVAVVIPFIGHKRAVISNVVCDYVKKIFKEDRSGEVSLEVVRCIAKVVKNCKYDVNPKVLYTLLSLKIKEVDRGEDKDNDKKEANRKRFLLSRRDKKRKKQMKELEKELEDAAATIDKKKKLKVHTEIINSVFLTYFRILKQARHSVCLSAVLEGLAKFAHLINVDFFDDLFTVINELVESGDLTYRECLHCIKTAFIILSGQGSSLNIDPLHFYQHLYATLFKLSAGLTSDDVGTALECLDIMVTKRRKQISQHRLLAFIKRLTTLALQLSADGALGALASARSFIVCDSKSEMLYDTEHEGTGMYLPELTDPEHCNAHNTALFDVHLARHHYHPLVRKYSEHLLGGCKSNVNGVLGDTTRKSAVELCKEFSQSKMEFKPPMMEKPKTVKKLHLQAGEFLQSDMQRVCSTTLEQQYTDINISKLLFHKGVQKFNNVQSIKKVKSKKRKKTKK